MLKLLKCRQLYIHFLINHCGAQRNISSPIYNVHIKLLTICLIILWGPKDSITMQPVMLKTEKIKVMLKLMPQINVTLPGGTQDYYKVD